MFSFLRPLMTVISLAIAFVLIVAWCFASNWAYIMEAADAADVEADPGTYSRILDILFLPGAILPQSVVADLGWIDFGAYALAIGFIGWMLLGSFWSIAWPRKGSSRSLVPKIRFGNLVCMGLFVALVFGWISLRFF